MPQSAADSDYERFLREVGKRIESLRAERHSTPEKLANNAGISLAELSNIEAGKLDFTLDTVVHFANAFEIKILELFRDTDFPSPSKHNEATQ